MVVAAAAGQRVVAAIAVEGIGMGVALECVALATAGEILDANQLVGVGRRDLDGRAAAAERDRHLGGGVGIVGEIMGTVAAVQRVVAGAAGEYVIAVAGGELV